MPSPWLPGVKPKDLKARRLVVSGSRTFDDYDFLRKKLDHLTFWWEDVVLYVGDQRSPVERFRDGRYSWDYCGADWLALKWAEENWYERLLFVPDWDRHGKAAGPIRNRDMLEKAGGNAFFVAFWDGKSPGTKDCITQARKLLKPGRINVYKF